MSGKPEKTTLKNMTFQLAVLVLLFYIVPIPAMSGSSMAETAFLSNTLLILNPAVCFALSLMHSFRFGFVWYVPLVSGVLFLPTVFLFYNTTALPYIAIYILFSYIGAGAGHSIYKNRNSDDE